jgi:uncharacterized protein (TIGR02145 family)
MKKLIILLLGIIVISCSSNNDENNNSSSSEVPVSPTDLTGFVVSSSQIELSWTDASTNETGFTIERKTGLANYSVIGTVNQNVVTFSDSGLMSNTTYTYRVKAFNTLGDSQNYTNELTLITTLTAGLPTLTTTVSSSITQTTAISGGTISNDGGAAINARGICWSTNPNPTIALSTKTNDGAGTGTFTSNLIGLTANTIYYIRAYATNSVGTAYGNQLNFTTLQNSATLNVTGPNITDIDGNTYQSVANCGITFSKQNLNVSKYTDGTPIPEVSNSSQFAALTTGAWCYYNNDPANGTIYGKLYNWYAIAGIYDAASLVNPSLRKKLAPTGWHIPTDSEWTQLTDCLGGESVAGGKMKSTGTSLWQSPNTAATNESGFSALPGGYRLNGGAFFTKGFDCYFWSSTTAFNENDFWGRNLGNDYGFVDRLSFFNRLALSVRIVKD